MLHFVLTQTNLQVEVLRTWAHLACGHGCSEGLVPERVLLTLLGL